MKNPKYIALALAIIIAGLVIVNFSPKQKDNPVQEDSSTKLTAQSSDIGDVIVEVTPLSASEFKVSLETHSVELDNDMVRDISLIDSSGQTHRPISWDGSPPGGHHRQGIIKFGQSPTSGSISLEVRNIGGIPERRFSWNFP